MALDALQHLEAVHLRQFQVQQDHLGWLCQRAVSVRALARDELQRLNAIARDVDDVGKVGLLHGAKRQPHFIAVVLDQQDFNGRSLIRAPFVIG